MVEVTIPIRWRDVDNYGHVNNAVYLTYLEEACDLWGPMYADLFFGVSSRSRAVRSRAELGWAPTRFDVIDDIRHGSYRAAYKGVQR